MDTAVYSIPYVQGKYQHLKENLNLKGSFKESSYIVSAFWKEAVWDCLSTATVSPFTSNTKSRLILGTAQTTQRTPQWYWCYWFLTTYCSWFWTDVCQNRHSIWDPTRGIWAWTDGSFPTRFSMILIRVASYNFSHRCDFRGKCRSSRKTWWRKYLLLVCLFPTQEHFPSEKAHS